MRPITAAESWTTSLRPHDAISRAVVEFERRTATVNLESETDVSATGGSRWGFRLFGVYMNAGRKRLPWQATLRLSDGDPESSIWMSLRSDPGRPLIAVPRVSREYEVLFEEMVASMRRATTAEDDH